MKVTESLHSRSWFAALIVALMATLFVAVPAWAGTVQIQDDAHVLDATRVQNAAATLPVGIYIWTTTQDAANKSTFDSDVRNKVDATFPIAMGVNSQAQHVSIQIGRRAGLSQSAAVAAESQAVTAFVATMRSSHDYTAAAVSATGSLRGNLAAAHRGRGTALHSPANSSGGGILLIVLLVIGAIVVIALVMGRRRLSRRGSPWGARSRMGAGPPPMGSYPGEYDQGYGGPGYGAPYRSGMGPGAAGAIGAVGGGLLGYELGKSVGEEHQFRQDEMMYDRDRGQDDQGDWVVGQDGDFGNGGSDLSGGDTSGGGGDW